MSQTSGQSNTSPKNFLRSVFGSFILGVHDVFFRFWCSGLDYLAKILLLSILQPQFRIMNTFPYPVKPWSLSVHFSSYLIIVAHQFLDRHLQILGFLQSRNNRSSISSTLETSGESHSIMSRTASKSLVIHPLNPVRALFSWSICFVFIFQSTKWRTEVNNTCSERSNYGRVTSAVTMFGLQIIHNNNNNFNSYIARFA